MTELPNKTTPIRLNVLGELEIIRDGELIWPPTNKRACHLLVMLALKKTYDLQELVSIFWEGEHLHHEDQKEVKRVLDNLAQVFTAVRQTLGIDMTILKSDGTTLRWIENECYLLSSDIDDFRRFARSATPEDQQTALTLVRGKVAEHIPVERKLTDAFFAPDRQEQEEDIEKLLRRLEPGTSDEAVLDRRVRDVLKGRYREDLREQTSPGGEVGPLPPAPTIVTRGRMPHGARRWQFILAALAGFVALGIAVWRLWPGSSHTLAIPPPGSVVDAQTGQVLHFVPSSHVAKSEPAEAQVLLWVCDLSTKQPCTYPKTTHPLVAHRGDVLEVWIRLYNEEPTPIPLLGVSVGWFYTYETVTAGELFSTKQVFNVKDAAYDWPNSKQLDRGTGMSLYVQMLPQGEGITYLPSYIPGSTVLSSLNSSFHRMLPDGIMQHETLENSKTSSTKHIWLSDVGAPSAACNECLSQYVRFIHFRVRML
ncbi:MAG TPA: hypothetical protein VIH71_16700 [Solirubrobacteraceae bacterium]